jgi:hypothetical protein
MDPTNVVALAFLAVAVWLISRPLLESAGGTGDFLAQLFVAPDRSLGWPRGVQEGDAQWGWRTAATEALPLTFMPEIETEPERGDLCELGTVVRAGSFVVPVQPVRRT